MPRLSAEDEKSRRIFVLAAVCCSSIVFFAFLALAVYLKDHGSTEEPTNRDDDGWNGDDAPPVPLAHYEASFCMQLGKDSPYNITASMVELWDKNKYFVTIAALGVESDRRFSEVWVYCGANKFYFSASGVNDTLTKKIGMYIPWSMGACIPQSIGLSPSSKPPTEERRLRGRSKEPVVTSVVLFAGTKISQAWLMTRHDMGGDALGLSKASDDAQPALVIPGACSPPATPSLAAS